MQQRTATTTSPELFKATLPIFRALKDTNTAKFECAKTNARAILSKNYDTFDLQPKLEDVRLKSTLPAMPDICPTYGTLVVERDGEKYAAYTVGHSIDVRNADNMRILIEASKAIESYIAANREFFLLRNSKGEFTTGGIPQ